MTLPQHISTAEEAGEYYPGCDMSHLSRSLADLVIVR